MTGLPVRLAAQLEAWPATRRFLIDELWGEQAVGVVGGEPKCCKSFLALELAVAVASGRPALRRFAVAEPGPVLLYAAEDALHVVRERLVGICAAAGVELDRDALRETVARLRPRLLMLDPFVRLHRVNENAADEVAPLLAYLRDLQRTHGCAVLLVHHARKGGHARAGQALRGSSELHAWGDSNLYLRRNGERLMLMIEHRAAPSAGPIELSVWVTKLPFPLHVVERVESIDPCDTAAVRAALCVSPRVLRRARAGVSRGLGWSKLGTPNRSMSFRMRGCLRSSNSTWPKRSCTSRPFTRRAGFTLGRTSDAGSCRGCLPANTGAGTARRGRCRIASCRRG